jgi:hypothetical protein
LKALSALTKKDKKSKGDDSTDAKAEDEAEEEPVETPV